MTDGIDFFRERRVLVVGGSSGIGAGIGAAFQRLGAVVTVTGATAAEVQRAKSDPALAGVAVLQLDVRSDAAVLACFGALSQLDVLVNCAGVIRRGEELDPAVFAAVLDINLNGSMRTCAAARTLLAASKGCIINTASMLSFFGGGLVPAYSASKGGVAQLTKSLAIAFASDGIAIGNIAEATLDAKLVVECEQQGKACRLPWIDAFFLACPIPAAAQPVVAPGVASQHFCRCVVQHAAKSAIAPACIALGMQDVFVPRCVHHFGWHGDKLMTAAQIAHEKLAQPTHHQLGIPWRQLRMLRTDLGNQKFRQARFAHKLAAQALLPGRQGSACKPHQQQHTCQLQ